jgi:hypothetical protein
MYQPESPFQSRSPKTAELAIIQQAMTFMAAYMEEQHQKANSTTVTL